MKTLVPIAFALCWFLQGSAWANCQTNAATFTSQKLRILTASYDPSLEQRSYRQPAVRPLTTSETSTYEVAFQNAFNLAPAFFRSQLCSLDYVVIDPFTPFPGGWGFWAEDSYQQSLGPANAVGVAAGLWTARPSFASFETDLTASVKRAGWGGWRGTPTYTSATLGKGEADFTATLLGILAHEVGHIIWRDQDEFLQSSCYQSWNPLGRRHADIKSFHGFGVRARYSKPKGARSFAELYQSASWASLFAAVSPDEDFIETYKLIVMNSSSPRLDRLEVQYPGSGSVDIMAQFRDSRTNLFKKQDCFSKVLTQLSQK